MENPPSKLTIEQMLRIQDEIKFLESPLEGRWPYYSLPQAVIEAIHVEKALKNYLAEHKTLITIAGNIGLGKTTFARIMSHCLDIEGSYELDAEHDHIDDELLAKFLIDKPRYCFQLQQHFRSKRLKFRAQNAQKKGSCVEDRTPEEDPGVFYRFFHKCGYLTDSQLDQLENEAIQAYKKSYPADLMIILLGRPELSRQRILQRERPEEINAWRLEEELRPLAELYKKFSYRVPGYGLHLGPAFTLNLDYLDITNWVHKGNIFELILNALVKPGG